MGLTRLLSWVVFSTVPRREGLRLSRASLPRGCGPERPTSLDARPERADGSPCDSVASRSRGPRSVGLRHSVTSRAARVGAILQFMATREDDPKSVGQPPDGVRATVTIIPGPRGPSIRERVAHIWIQVNPLVLIGLAVAVAILAIVVATALGGRGGTARTEGAQTRGVAAGPAAAASGHAPPRCSSTTDKRHHSRLTLAEFDRRVWCERYNATPNSSIYQFVGVP